MQGIEATVVCVYVGCIYLHYQLLLVWLSGLVIVDRYACFDILRVAILYKLIKMLIQ
jgi:hypothetical protein